MFDRSSQREWFILVLAWPSRGTSPSALYNNLQGNEVLQTNLVGTIISGAVVPPSPRFRFQFSTATMDLSAILS